MEGARMYRDDASHRAEDVRLNFWRTARKAARHVPFMEDVVSAYYCALDHDTSIKTKGILLGALAYFVLPVDAIPDILAGVGFTDDVAVLSAALAAVKASITPAHRSAARKAIDDWS
ncbi:MAG: YkvA family protein [Rhizobiaceae bacterium]|nr:YkvA family protein [Rhizobiaceae bacterium]